ncbi:MAG: RNA 3'-terminal phosphate cyclase [bacterium]
MIQIDGRLGEGGGQILRTALSLSAATGKPFRIVNIRKKRSKPGLRHQHLACVNAAAEISGAKCKGNVLQSLTLEFLPETIQPGNYFFNIPTAGSSMQVIQTVLPILSFAPAPSVVTVRGGTHNPGAPPYEFFRDSFLPLLRQIGFSAEVQIRKHGFYPVGGGEVVATIQQQTACEPKFSLHQRGEPDTADGEILLSWLPAAIAERERDAMQQRLGWAAAKIKIIEITDSPGPGNVVMIRVRYGTYTYLFTAFGQRGKPAEQVATEACDAFLSFRLSKAVMDEHLANQVLLYLALNGGGSFTTPGISLHTKTNIEVIKRFLDNKINVRKKDDGCFEIQVGQLAG